MNELERTMMRLDLEADTAHATQLILDGHADQVDDYLAGRNYAARVAQYKNAGGK